MNPEPFESAVEALISGEAVTLASLLGENPELARARSARAHRATLLHYLAANGVEDERQKTPENAVEMAAMLLRAGAEVDATAWMYGGEQTTLCMLVSSVPPAKAGVQIALVDLLVDFGARVDGPALMTALAHGYADAAEALVRRGARADNLAAAAGLGRIEEAVRMLPESNAETRHRALALAAQHGRAEILKLLLDAGEDPSRYNPAGYHAHSTPLHQAALAGHEAAVRLLVERGARLDVEDTVHHGTPLGWAIYGGRDAVAEYLRKQR
ncbi:MAG TPA: ankyrin repeat domain-containing protein [Bryobacteraceae bacterium]|nr:ankyrin repeat domain-containing protein [Bryobacteraceae bacterium]